MIDVGFPVIQYGARQSAVERGRAHGEQFRQAIGELVAIRRLLMQEKNPALTPEKIQQLAQPQWQATVDFDTALAEELMGISQGANLPPVDLIVLNNYTDFRDIHVPDQGCSTVYVNRQEPIAGQTWDMHRTAKHYVCCIEIDAEQAGDRQVLFSLVGCLGLMGYNGRGLMVGVNNINTDGARPGVIWPALVRGLVNQTRFDAMAHMLQRAAVTSGHAYLLGSADRGEFWEVLPGLAERVSAVSSAEPGHLFHTNHCLGESARQRERTDALSSTTHVRYDLLERKLGAVETFDDVYGLLNDHENYPQAICSNYQSGSQDPSVTCGGAVGNLAQGQVVMWRGDELYDSNFVRRQFQLGVA
jgi:isopenicillin-N N-acyltransferase-like protein